jgi:hypothetical protein
MKTFTKTIARHHFHFKVNDEDNALAEVSCGEYRFKMVFIEDHFKILSPENLPHWIINLEPELSEAIIRMPESD